MARTNVWDLHSSESPAEAEATGLFLDEEPTAPRLMRVVEGADAGPQVLGKDTRLGRWTTVEPATNSRTPPTPIQSVSSMALCSWHSLAHSQQVPSRKEAFGLIPLQARVLKDLHR